MASKKQLFLWITSPIDWWSGMIDLHKFSPRDFASEFEDALKFEEEVYTMLGEAKGLAADHGWEGDFSQGPFLSALPSGDGNTDLIIAWKQSNNGTCYIAARTLLVGRGFDTTIPHQLT